VVGHVNKPHGTRGEVFVWPLTDHPEGAFAEGTVLLPAGSDERTPDPNGSPLRVEKARTFRKGFLVGFEGVENRSAAETLRGLYLLRPFDEVPPAEEGELFYHEILGMTVETRDGEIVGEVAEVYELRPADLLEVRGSRGMTLVPFTSRVVASVDRAGRRLIIDPPPGLLDL
jgi:16S rRNA processing protein RimM